ncbi:hypothetical protein PG994_007274 [Apiospora phragmitis]|uniref:Uncharacterized protein n=1 Tax=Apiospora phragmitis TaxID=2905665 RepID=A0ABR1V0B7_9PEZI
MIFAWGLRIEISLPEAGAAATSASTAVMQSYTLDALNLPLKKVDGDGRKFVFEVSWRISWNLSGKDLELLAHDADHGGNPSIVFRFDSEGVAGTAPMGLVCVLLLCVAPRAAHRDGNPKDAQATAGAGSTCEIVIEGLGRGAADGDFVAEPRHHDELRGSHQGLDTVRGIVTKLVVADVNIPRVVVVTTELTKTRAGVVARIQSCGGGRAAATNVEREPAAITESYVGAHGGLAEIEFGNIIRRVHRELDGVAWLVGPRLT